ncbi:hypothetical protein [Persicobacter diffluens]|uniref:Protein BatD n=1 Tax=Persicobacter diffluens TaxID=981 RepID=A0AAN4VY23_9BACT|nr:hypothetical protein PEDI_10070 [Persicobacter diffluens]
MKKFSVFVLLFLWTLVPSYAQQIDAFATLTLSRKTTYAQQPVRAKVTVYTATWFTDPLDIQPIQIENGFAVPFFRAVPGIFHINGKQYSGLEFYYQIFPLAEGALQIPDIQIKTASPPVGDYKGKPITITAKGKAIKIKETPAGLGENWFVANRVQLSEQYDQPLLKLKQGDVVERKVKVYAQGTLPIFIPETKFPKEDFATVYPKSGTTKDERDDESVNGSRTDRALYLFDRQGEFLIHGIEISYWNPLLQRVQHYKTKDQKVVVAANPDLGMVASIKDSLQAANATFVDAAPKEHLWFGYQPWKVLVAGLLLVVLLSKAIKILRKWRKKIRAHWLQYKRSEPYLLRQIKAGHSVKAFQSEVYEWLNVFGQGAYYGLRDFFGQTDADQKILRAFEKNKASKSQRKRLLQAIKRRRKALLVYQKQRGGLGVLKSLNPGS